MLSCVEDMGVQDVVSGHHGLTNVVASFPCLSEMKWFVEMSSQGIFEGG